MSKNEHKEIEAQNVTKLMNSLLGFMAFLFIGLSFAFDVRNAFIFALIFGVFIFGMLFILSFRHYVWASGGSEFTYKKFIFSIIVLIAVSTLAIYMKNDWSFSQGIEALRGLL